MLGYSGRPALCLACSARSQHLSPGQGLCFVSSSLGRGSDRFRLGHSPSGCLLPAPPNENAFALDLAICQGNWQGAESDPASLQELIQAEEDAGFVREFPSLEAAQSYFGADRVAVGRVNIVHSHGKKPRLVVDSSVCHTNQACRVPEKSSLPSLADVRSAFPLRQDIEEASAFSADIRAAHKTVRIREKDQGLLGFRQQERLLFYKVAPFGAVFSSHWFARVGGLVCFTSLSFSYMCSCFTQTRPSSLAKPHGSALGRLSRALLFRLLWHSH